MCSITCYFSFQPDYIFIMLCYKSFYYCLYCCIYVVTRECGSILRAIAIEWADSTPIRRDRSSRGCAVR
jgi:hypothetical protein